MNASHAHHLDGPDVGGWGRGGGEVGRDEDLIQYIQTMMFLISVAFSNAYSLNHTVM